MNNPINNQLPVMPPPPNGGGRRARWGRQLMSGTILGLHSLPDWFATYAIAAYAIALLGVNILNSNYATEWYFWVFGIVWVVGFFGLSVKYSRDWSVRHIRHAKAFEKKLFWTSFIIRAIYVVFIYWFYTQVTGEPYEYSKADSIGYFETATDFAMYYESGILWPQLAAYAAHYLSDMGYPLFLMFPINIIGGAEANMFIRLVHALLGAYTAVLIYRITARSMGETTARFAGIFCMLHPVLICYAGMTLKEVLMTCILVLFIDLADRMLRSRKYTFATIAPMVLVGLLLFLFRTVLGVVAFMAVFFALVMMDTKIVSWGKKIMLGIVLVGVLFMAASENIMNEIHQITQVDVMEEQQFSMKNRYGSEKGTGSNIGNKFANYAGAAVFAPLIFTIPFPTMVATEGQEDMRLIHGGNWMRNVMSGFVILAMFMLLLSGDWRKYTLPLAMLLGYLVVLVFSSFAHSLRFHIPVMPFEMMFAAYVIANMRKKHRSWYLYWCMFMVVTCFGWNWLKLKGRGL